jgi:hypothetical protein
MSSNFLALSEVFLASFSCFSSSSVTSRLHPTSLALNSSSSSQPICRYHLHAPKKQALSPIRVSVKTNARDSEEDGSRTTECRLSGTMPSCTAVHGKAFFFHWYPI